MTVCLRYRSPLYLGDGIDEAELQKLKKTLQKKPFLGNVYLITFAGNHSDQLDIFHSRYLQLRDWGEEPPYVIGIAKSYEEALRIVEGIAAACYEKRGDACMKEYLMGA